MNAAIVKQYLSGQQKATIGRNVAISENADAGKLHALPCTSTSLSHESSPSNESLPSQPNLKYKKRRKIPVESNLFKSEYKVERPSVRFDDLGGIQSILLNLRDLIEKPLFYPEVFHSLGIEPPKGILLCGPSGCGKTYLALAIAGEYDVSFLNVSATEIVTSMSGGSELKIREIFDEAKNSAPCILFIDDIDAIVAKRENTQREMEKRIISQLGSCLDDLSERFVSSDGGLGSAVVVIAATNRPESLDPCLRRAGRFDHEIKMPVPNENARAEIFRKLSRKIKLKEDVCIAKIARNTPGYVAADLRLLLTEAAMHAIDRLFANLPKTSLDDNQLEEIFTYPNSNFVKRHVPKEYLDSFCLDVFDFEVALTRVQPSAKREGFAVVPDISWDSIGALQGVREELRLAVVEPMRHPELFSILGIDSPAGVLLWGPPGCGKTMLAKAVANESHSNFISIKGPELLNKYVGESEKAVRQVFERARASAPCVIFFDELDALCPRRGDDSSAGYASRIVNQLLTEMDGLEGRQKVYIVGATNRPDIIDPAILRPGRLDKLVYVQMPNAEERHDILKHQTKRSPLHPSVNLKALAEDPRCEGFSGADLAALVREASLLALRNILLQQDMSPFPHFNVNIDILVNELNFNDAFTRVYPSVSVRDRQNYDKLYSEFTTLRLK